MIGQQAPSGFGGASSPAAGAFFNSVSGSGAGEAFPTGSVESLGSSSTSIFCAISRSLLGGYSSRFSERYDLPGVCLPFYRIQPWPLRILIVALQSRDCRGWLASGWLAQEGGVQPLGGGGYLPSLHFRRLGFPFMLSLGFSCDLASCSKAIPQLLQLQFRFGNTGNV